jgi:hypothetical protein
VRFEVLMVVKMLSFWVVMQCGFVGGYFSLEYGNTFLQNVGIYLQVHTASQPKTSTLLYRVVKSPHSIAISGKMVKLITDFSLHAT